MTWLILFGRIITSWPNRIASFVVPFPIRRNTKCVTIKYCSYSKGHSLPPLFGVYLSRFKEFAHLGIRMFVELIKI